MEKLVLFTYSFGSFVHQVLRYVLVFYFISLYLRKIIKYLFLILFNQQKFFMTFEIISINKLHTLQKSFEKNNFKGKVVFLSCFYAFVCCFSLNFVHLSTISNILQCKKVKNIYKKN